MIKLSELQMREIVMIDGGRRLGPISDIDIDIEQGKVLSLIIFVRGKKSGLFGKMDELIIPWEDIMTIGVDVILIGKKNRDKYDEQIGSHE